MELSSFAIWDKNKVIMAISAAIWVINLGFQLAGKSTSSLSSVDLNWYDLISGIVEVNDRFQSLWPSCLIHQQIRAEWVPEAKACAITNIEICKGFFINLLVTDVILLFIMLAGLLRLRRGGGSFYISRLLWKQVGHCRILLVVMLLSHCIRHSSGCHLARYCHLRRTPASGKHS
jgi:hypothetical protein